MRENNKKVEKQSSTNTLKDSVKFREVAGVSSLSSLSSRIYKKYRNIAKKDREDEKI